MNEFEKRLYNAKFQGYKNIEDQAKDKMTIWLCGIGAIIAVAIFLSWVNKHDKAIEQSSEAYEKCVMAEYNTTPSAWYNEHGQYPECNPKP